MKYEIRMEMSHSDDELVQERFQRPRRNRLSDCL